MKQVVRSVARSVASEVTVYFNFGFSGVNLDSTSISQYALTDLLSHLRQSVTIRAFNEALDSKNTDSDENLAISDLEIVEIVFVTQPQLASLTKALTKFHFKITFKVFHTSSNVTSSAFEDVDKITNKMFEKITKTTIMPEFECFPCFVKPDFRATCTRQHICGVMAI